MAELTDLQVGDAVGREVRHDPSSARWKGEEQQKWLAPPCGVAAARPSKTEVKRTSKLVAEAKATHPRIPKICIYIMTQYDAARFELLGGFERACALPASDLLRTESVVDSCAGGCAQLCLAASASPRICLGFECRSHSGACLLFSAHPNATSERAHSECWRRRIAAAVCPRDRAHGHTARVDRLLARLGLG